jgi:cephalosporin hydroxylase
MESVTQPTAHDSSPDVSARPPSALSGALLMSIQNGTLAFTHRGVVMQKNPFDVALYQKLIWETKPRTIVEIGSNAGGSALWFADLLRMFGIDGHVHSLDIRKPDLASGEGFTFYEGDGRRVGDAFSPSWVERQPRPLLVIEDADHVCATTAAVLAHFGPLMRSGEYIVVEDAILTAMGVEHLYDGGPRRAIREFLAANTGFEIDTAYCDYFGSNVTWNVDGFLRRT